MANEQLLAEHPRCFGRGQARFNPWHYLPGLERKPGALREGAPFQQWALPDAFRQVDERWLTQSGGDTACVDLRLAGREHGLEPLDGACAVALAQGAVRAPVVLHQLHRLRSPPPPDPLPVPDGLRLARAPAAACARYDRLRSAEQRHAH